MDKILGLSEQQKACLRLVHQGLRTKEIAPIVQLAPASIDTYIRQAMIQLGTRDRREAARIFVQSEADGGHSVDAPVGAPAASENHDSKAAVAPSALSERFVSELEGLPKPLSDRGNRRRRIGQAIAALLRPPPVGGVPNELALIDRIREMLRAACFMVVVVASLTLIFIGALRTLR